MKNILITGGKSRFCRFLKTEIRKYNTYFTTRNNFDILKFDKMEKFLRNKKIDILIHIAGLSRPMSIHDTNIAKSIDLNIIGTANIVKLCKKKKIKLIYFSTNYVYPCTNGNYKESDSLRPINNYAWSKLGGESSVMLLKNSLILRIAMTDFPFTHSKAIKGAYSSFLYNKTVAKIIPYIINEKGVLNIGGKKREIYTFAKKFAGAKVRPIALKKIKHFPKDSSLNIGKLSKILKRYKLKKIRL